MYHNAASWHMFCNKLYVTRYDTGLDIEHLVFYVFGGCVIFNLGMPIAVYINAARFM